MTIFSRAWSAKSQGLLWCLVFVVLDAVQAVYFGATLQRVDGFLLGGLVFGLSAMGCIVWVRWKTPNQIDLVRRHWQPLLGLNITAAGGWLCYFIAIQLIEPAVAFTLFSGIIPLVTISAAYLRVPEGQKPRNWLEGSGNLLIGLGLLALVTVSVLGLSGFVRGGMMVAVWGCVMATISGSLIAGMLLYGQRLNGLGVLPITQFGFRFPLFIVLAALAWLLGLDAKGPIILSELLVAIGIGLLVLALPIYAVQKAISLTSSLTIGTVAATAPLMVFALQQLEGRVQFSGGTSVGLVVYSIGAALAAIGASLAGGVSSGSTSANTRSDTAPTAKPTIPV